MSVRALWKTVSFFSGLMYCSIKLQRDPVGGHTLTVKLRIGPQEVGLYSALVEKPGDSTPHSLPFSAGNQSLDATIECPGRSSSMAKGEGKVYTEKLPEKCCPPASVPSTPFQRKTVEMECCPKAKPPRGTLEGDWRGQRGACAWAPVQVNQSNVICVVSLDAHQGAWREQ